MGNAVAYVSFVDSHPMPSRLAKMCLVKYCTDKNDRMGRLPYLNVFSEKGEITRVLQNGEYRGIQPASI